MNSFYATPLGQKIQAWQHAEYEKTHPDALRPVDPDAEARADEEWEEKAITGLFKKLKSSKMGGEKAVQDMVAALETKDAKSRCVCLKRSVDGRLQIAGRKGLPHFIFCRIFRFRDIVSHSQLRSTASCSNGYYAKKGAICVNPYHYERNPPSPALPMLFVPRSAPGVSYPAHFDKPDTSVPIGEVAMPPNSELPDDLVDLHFLSPLSLESTAESGMSPAQGSDSSRRSSESSDGPSGRKSSHDSGLSSDYSGGDHSTESSPSQDDGSGQQLRSNSFGSDTQFASNFGAAADRFLYSSSAASFNNSSGTLVAEADALLPLFDQMDVTADPFIFETFESLDIAPYSDTEMTDWIVEQSQQTYQPTQTRKQMSYHQSMQQSNLMESSQIEVRQTFQQAKGEEVFQQISRQTFSQQTSDQTSIQSYQQTNLGEYQQPVVMPMEQQSVEPNVPPTERIGYMEPEFWCSVAYYELQDRLGGFFNVPQAMRTFRVDGYTDSMTADRYSVARLSNSRRTDVIEKTRGNIGKGVRLSYTGDEVFVECISDKAIFVQSTNGNELHGLIPQTVIKVPPGCSLKIFSNYWFAQKLTAAVPNGYEAVFALIENCSARISFVKGWGQDYLRTKVIYTPCWLDVSLNGPLVWLDKVLTQMGSPSTKCTSRS
ncbi:Mothers against decapentaplegic-like protein 2 [Hypsibius exemplaris]|uniref:Mothers against decapentaplegic homolog n=1 Tax=Hypsibius exemplaris TaxID=2072580 RepID=A0A1W0XAP1_HYPEX|nr:Mothers against decapentaplegic-like protein 2 [Hypsibius exemplaris]